MDSGLGHQLPRGRGRLGISLVLLTGFLGPLVVLASWNFIHERVKEFHIALLVLQTAMLGAFVSLDLVLFYVFCEAMLIPMYLLIGVWGSEQPAEGGDEVLPLHAGRLAADAGRHPLPLLRRRSRPGRASFDYGTIYNSLLAANRQLSSCVQGSDCAGLSPLALR